MNPRTQEPKNKRGILPIRSFAVAQGQVCSGQALNLRMTGGFQRCFGSFLRASGGPIFRRVLYHNPTGKYRGKQNIRTQELKNSRTQEPKNGKNRNSKQIQKQIISEIRNKSGDFSTESTKNHEHFSCRIFLP